jgi:lysozyme
MAGDKSPWDKKTVPAAATVVIKRIEKFEPKPYNDNPSIPNGTWTIGYGTTRDENGKPITAQTPPITEAQAVQLLMRDMGSALASVAKAVKVGLLNCEAAALISWTYNLGGGSLSGSTMLKVLNAGQKSEVPSEMRKWINQGGKPFVGLLRRRWAEAAIFLGDDPDTACNRAWKEINALTDWPAF